MRVAIITLMFLHGFAHLPGFAGSWRLTTFPDLPYHTTLLNGRFDVGDAGMRVVGTLWLLVALAFAGSALGALRGSHWWAGAALITAMVSLALCALEWPATRIGVPVNVAIIVALVAGRNLGWL
jgi:hypothetical protein